MVMDSSLGFSITWVTFCVSNKITYIHTYIQYIEHLMDNLGICSERFNLLFTWTSWETILKDFSWIRCVTPGPISSIWISTVVFSQIIIWILCRSYVAVVVGRMRIPALTSNPFFGGTFRSSVVLRWHTDGRFIPGTCFVLICTS